MGVNKKRLFTVILVVVLIILVAAILIIGIAAYRYIKISNMVEKSLTPSETYKLNSGCYYLNGDEENCYFEIINNTIQLKGSKEQFETMYGNFVNPIVPFEEWYINQSEQWDKPIEYAIIVRGDEKRLAWNMNYDETGSLLGYNFDTYIDENAFKYNSNYFIKT